MLVDPTAFEEPLEGSVYAVLGAVVSLSQTSSRLATIYRPVVHFQLSLTQQTPSKHTKSTRMR